MVLSKNIFLLLRIRESEAPLPNWALGLAGISNLQPKVDIFLNAYLLIHQFGQIDLTLNFSLHVNCIK